ncbi:hypothetical protein GCM10028789_18620 [Sinomonas halotolerans]
MREAAVGVLMGSIYRRLRRRHSGILRPAPITSARGPGRQRPRPGREEGTHARACVATDRIHP